MTIIAAYKDPDGTVHMAADRRVSDDATYVTLAQPKIFKDPTGRLLFGCCGSPLQQQILQNLLRLPKFGELPTTVPEAIRWYMKFLFPRMRHILEDNDTRPPKNASEGLTSLLIAWPGIVLEIEDEMFATAVTENFICCGSGMYHAQGALAVLDGLDDYGGQRKVMRAVEIANQFVLSCGGPIDYMRTDAIQD